MRDRGEESSGTVRLGDGGLLREQGRAATPRGSLGAIGGARTRRLPGWCGACLALLAFGAGAATLTDGGVRIGPFVGGSPPAPGGIPAGEKSPANGGVKPGEEAVREPSPAPESRGDPTVTVADGVLQNADHGFRFLVPEGWALMRNATADEMVFEVPSCGDCLLRILVIPGEGENVSMDETVRSLRKQILESGDVRILSEQRTKIARQKAYTLVKEETLPADAAGRHGAETDEGAGPRRLLSRYVTFNYRGDKYYLVLRAPRERFSGDEDGLERLLRSFRFGSPA